MCTKEDYKDMWLLEEHRHYIETELDSWHRDYLPIHVGGVVLDVGAGCGETARFYLLHGASKVIAIEASSQAYRRLCENFKGDDRVIPIKAYLGNIKVDVEGAEEDMVLETHFPYIIKKERIGRMKSRNSLDEVLLLKFRKNKGLTGKVANLWNFGIVQIQKLKLDKRLTIIEIIGFLILISLGWMIFNGG